MRVLIFTIISLSLFADSHKEEFDVTSGIVRRNWSLKKSDGSSDFHIRFFTSKETCETWLKLFYYQNSKCELQK